MNFSNGNLLTIDEILSDVLSIVDDEGMKLRSKGWYTGQVKQALEELSFDTFFGEFHGEYNLPSNLQMQIPTGAFNINDVFGIGGNGCTIEGSHKIWHKRGFINSSSGNGYTARSKENGPIDPFYNGNGIVTQGGSIKDNDTIASSLYYYSIQNGIIMFSESCRAFGMIRLVFNGVADDVAGAPLIPLFLRQAVKDWVSVQALQIKANKKVGTSEQNYWLNIKNGIEGKMLMPYEGSWAKAELRVKRMDKGQKRDLNEYYKRFNH